MKYGVLAAVEYFGQCSLIELRDGIWHPVAKGTKSNLQKIAAALNEHDERSQPAATAVPIDWDAMARLKDDDVDTDAPVIGAQEVESWTQEQLTAARARIIPEPPVAFGGATLYREPNGRYYSTEAAKMVTGQAFIKPKLKP